MEDTSGFYKNEEGNLLFAPNFIEAPTYSLTKELKHTYAYPFEGWYWFDSEDEARTFLKVFL